MHHDIAHTFIHAYLFIYTCRFSFIHSCCQPHTHIRTHKFQCCPSHYYYYSETTNAQHSTSVLSCLDERTACIYIFSSDVCAFS